MIKLNLKKKLEEKKVKEKIAELIISQVKEHIARGVSPVRGQRRFERYKNPDKYPGDRKTKRPVNLEMTGEMLNALDWQDSEGTTVTIGFFDPEQSEKAKYHNDGTANMAKRQILPTKKNEEFNVSITRLIRDLYARIISDIIK
jgi:predicted AlkP superfamily phosphohydrolase/phosphomutase